MKRFFSYLTGTIVAAIVSLASTSTMAPAQNASVAKKQAHLPTEVHSTASIPRDVCIPSLEELARLSWPELKCLYQGSAAGSIPLGFVRGRSFLPPERCLNAFRSRIVNSVWRGKHFGHADCSVVNQWRVGRAIRGEVYYGSSWLDGKPAIIIDYRQTSRIWSDARDELREVFPGLYVGVMHRHCDTRARIKYYFVLEASQCSRE